MSRYTGHASLQELLGRASGGILGGSSSSGFGNAARGATATTDPLLSDPTPASPTGEARARALLPPEVAEALFGGGGAGGENKRPREGEEDQAADPAPVAPPPPPAADGGPVCPVCSRALALFASSSSAALDLEAVNRHVDACLIASKGKKKAEANAKGNTAGKKQQGQGQGQGQRQASLLGMRKVVKVKQGSEEAGERAEEKMQPAASSPPPPPPPPPPLSLPPLSETCFESRLVARRHAAANASSSSAAAAPSKETEPPPLLVAGAVVSLLRERSNAADGAAIRAVAFPGAAGSIGYLPASVSSKLAPLLDASSEGGRRRCCAATATLCEGPPPPSGSSGGGGGGPSSSCSLRVRVEVILPPLEGGSGPDDESWRPGLLRLVAAAAEAAREDSARSSSGPGGRLLAAALPALDAALAPRERGGDAHLFSREELAVLDALRGEVGSAGGGGGGGGVPREAAALFLRVYSSRRPHRWVRPSKVTAAAATESSSSEMEASAGAALALVRAGLAVPLLAAGNGGEGENGGEDALVAAADALTSDELRAALLSFSNGAPSYSSNSSSSSSSSPAYSSPLSASALRRMNKTDLLSLAARALRGGNGGGNGGGGAPAAPERKRARMMTAALCAALAAAPPPPPSSSSSVASSSSRPAPCPSPLLPAFRLKTAAMRALRRCERAAFLSEGVTFSTVAAAAAGGMRSLPRYRVDRLQTSASAVPPAFASRAEFLEYERALDEAAALDDALCLSLSASTPAERAEADAAVEAAMVPCVDFVTRRRQMAAGGGDGGGGGGGGGSGGGAGTTRKENAPPATAKRGCSPPQSPAAAPASSPASSSFLARFTALGVRLTCATVSAAWLEGKRRRAEADEIYWGCLGVTVGHQQQQQPRQQQSEGRPHEGIKRSFRRRGHWWTRLAINAEAAGRPSQALEVVEAALADDPDASVCWGDRLGLMRRGFRLAKPPRRWRAPPAAWAAAAAREPRERVLVAATLRDASSFSLSSKSRNARSVFEGDLTVERLALAFYSRPENGGWRGAHAEGGVWGCLFRALFHDVMFPPPSTTTTTFDDGVDDGDDNGALSMLRVPCQRYPLDFGSPVFYSNRKAQIDSLLGRIRASSPLDLARMVSRVWDRGLGPYAAGGTAGRWNDGSAGGSREELRELCGCLGGRALAAVLELFAKGVAREGGMPDLVLWRLKPQKKDSDDTFGEAMVVEVKGPRDRLSDNQRAWLAAFEDSCEIEAEVLKVVEPGSKKAAAVAAAAGAGAGSSSRK